MVYISLHPLMTDISANSFEYRNMRFHVGTLIFELFPEIKYIDE